MDETKEPAPSPEKLSHKERRARKRAERKAKQRAKRAEWNKKVRLFPANKKGYHVMHFMNLLRTDCFAR